MSSKRTSRKPKPKEPAHPIEKKTNVNELPLTNFRSNSKKAESTESAVSAGQWDLDDSSSHQRKHDLRIIFELARFFKANPGYAEKQAEELHSVVREWHNADNNPLANHPFTELCIDFDNAWERVKYPIGQGPVDLIFAISQDAEPPEFAQNFDSEPLVSLITFCRELQYEAGDAPFFLSCRVAGSLLEIGHRKAADFLKHLVKTVILRKESEGTLQTHKASEYRYLHPI